MLIYIYIYMRLRNFAKLFTGLLAISALPASIVFSNSNTQIHSSFFVENKITDDISWSIDGKGNIWPTDKSQISGTIEIPSEVSGKPVTGIANDAFRKCTSLTSINIPSSVTSIGDFAFNGCVKLISITFAEGSQLTSIGYWAFIGCSTLTSITIPSGVTSIGKSAFGYCPLTSIEFAGNQTYDWVPTVEGSNTVGGYIIQKGKDLSTNAVAGSLAYGKIDIKTASVPNNNIYEFAFDNCAGITSVIIPSNVTSIGKNAFDNCTSLTSVNFAEGSKLNNIGYWAFIGCNTLTSIIIPSSITSIGETAFGNCDKMGTITFNWNEEQLSKLTLGNNLFINRTSSQKINFHIPWGTKDQYKAKFTPGILGTNITANWIDDIQWSITDDGFISPANKDLIKGDVTIPNTVGGKVVTGIANSAFDSCSALTSINIPSGVTSIGDNAFADCSSLTTVNFDVNSRLTNIGNYAFQKCTSLTSINIPSGVTSIGCGAFAECSSLTSISIPRSVTKIYTGAFVNTTKLQDITFNWTGKILDDIIQKIKNPVHQRELTTWACIFANYNENTKTFENKMNVNVHLPKGINNLDVEKYKNNFQGIKDSGSDIPDGIGLDPATTHWIYDSNSNSKLPLILGLTFGFIILIGVGSYLGYRYYKHRKNSK